VKQLKVILADDNDTFREALKNVLVKKFDAEIVAEASNGTEFRNIRNLWNADLIFMDIMMPDTNGISLAREAIANDPALNFVAITMHYDKVYLLPLLGAGFKGCIFKNNIFSELENAIEVILNGQLYFPREISIN